MIIATIELPNNYSLQIDELVNKDVELTISKQKSYWKKELQAKVVIPKERRELLSKYLWQS
jgi:hypothetical protein